MKTKKLLMRALTLLLALLTLLSASSLGLSAAQVELADTGATVTSDGTARLYFNMSAVSWWTAGTSGNGNFAYFFNSSTNAWSAHSVNYSGSTYYVVIPKGSWTTVILTRNNTSTSPSWDNKWNQTGNITLSSTSNYISKFSEGSTSATWGTAVKPASTAGLSASASTVTTGTAVTLTPSLTSNASINTIESTTYEVGSGASVSGNTFTATQPGTYTVTATVTYHPNGYSSLTSTATASTTITVQASEYTYTASAGEGGTVSPASGSVQMGSGVSLTATPSAGYEFDKWTFTNGTGATNTATTTFTPTANGATAVASFKKLTYTVTASANPTAGGTVTKSAATVEHGGEVTFTASANQDDNYVFTGWTINGVASGETSSTLELTNIVENVNVVATFEQIPTYTVHGAVGSGQGTVSPVSQVIAQESMINFTATPAGGYRFTGWTISGSYRIQSGDLNNPSISIIPQEDGVTATANFTKEWTVNFVDMNGVSIKEVKVLDGESATAPTAPTVAHYTFTGWSTDFSNVTSDLTVQAQYEGDTYTVTVNTVTGGTVTTTATSVVYPGKVTLTATAEDGYTLVNWGITGDYTKDTESANTITLTPEANLTVNPQFALGRKLTVYTYSANGYKTLTLTEDGSNNVINAVDQSATQTFNGITWDKSNQTDISMSATELTAELSGKSSGSATDSNTWYADGKYLVADGYRTIVFRNDWNWTDVKLYAWNTSTGTNNAAFPGVAMKKATTSGGYDVYVMLVDASKYNKFIISGVKDDGSGTRDQSPDTSLTTDSIKSYKMNWSNGNQLIDAGLSMSTYTAHASSGAISLNDQLFEDGAWLGREEVWVYQNGTSSTVTYRRDLLDLVALRTDLDATNNADEGYTPESWADFASAFDTAYEVSGKASATQTEIDAAYDDLAAKYAALVPQTSVTVTYIQNTSPSSAHIGSTTINTVTGTVNVVQGKEVEVQFVAPYCYYISAVKINGELVEITGPNAWTYLASLAFTADTEIEVVYEQNPELIVQENGTTGGTVDFGSNVTNYEGKNLISYGYSSSFDVTAPNLYYIQSIYVGGQKVYEGDDETKTSITGCPLNSVTADVNIVITYAKRSTLRVEVLSYPASQGTLYYGDTAIPAEGMIIEALAGDSITITAVPNTGYGVQYWIVDSATAGRESTYTFSKLSSNHTIDVEWIELEEVNVTVGAVPNSAGKVVATSGSHTATSGTASNSFTVEQYSVVNLKATITDTRYVFANWSIEGSYYFNSGSRTDAEVSITATTDLVIKANYALAYRRVYLKDDAGWNLTNSTYVYCYDGSGDVGTAWPGYKMQYDSTLGYYYADVPFDFTGLVFNKGNSSGQVEYKDVKSSDNLFTNASDTTGYPTTYVEEGYYLQGKWNGKEFGGYDLQKFEDNGDGTYSLTITVTSTADGYIYVNPSNKNSLFWQPDTTGSTANPVTLTGPSSAYIAFANRRTIKVEIDTADFTKAYDVTFTFNPTTGEFSWTKVENVPTITVNGTDGRVTNDTDNINVANKRVGDTYFDADTIISVSVKTTYDAAHVVAGSPVTFYTKVNQNSVTKNYDYYVAGWVINGTDFVTATSLGDGVYSGSYIFTEDNSSIVPVYFHTKEWLTANNVSTVIVYAVADKEIENWDKYLAAYTWYKDSAGATVYEQFGAYTGQLMIPVAGLDGVYYTYIETATNSGVPVSGITFSNYAPADNFDTKPVVDYGNIQTYDYYEFMALLNDGKENITFVIKDTNDTYNSTRVNVNENETLSDFTFVQYTDYSGLKTDIFGNNIESIDSTRLDSEALYIIQAGDKNHSNVGHLDGQFYVDCYLYDATGKYLGSCYSYELHSDDSEIWTTLAPYENQRVYISYESVNGNRYDGEWYGDADVSVTINLAVKVAVMGEDGKYTIDTDGDINKAIYGEAFINNVQNIDVARGETANLTSMALAGYKFVGWYTADGTLFSTNPAYKVTTAVGTYYVAVFEPLKEGSFYVNHYIYTGNGTSDYNPPVHGGNAQLYVGIQNVTQGKGTSLVLGNSVGLEATEGDKLLITIATDGIGADKFFSWYTDAVDKNGFTTFEEVGVDSIDNLYNNNGTVVGRTDRVYFQFEYTVGSEIFSLNFYSDLMPVSVNAKLIYEYTDRYGNPKSYTVLYTLTPEEIEGFAGNEGKTYTPAYISSTDNSWVNTILANAPYVEDYFKDTTWKINSSMYETMTFHLWATQPQTMYTVTTTVVTDNGADVIVNKVPYNTVVDLDIRDLVPEASYTGFWYQDVNNNGTYEKTVDIILTYGPYYGYRVTQDMAMCYEPVEPQDEYEFNVSLDAPVYGREQTTDSEGNNKTDVVIIDYVVNILTPYFYYNHPEFTPIYNGQEITDEEWGKTLVTLESLVEAGYEVSYGVLLQQVGTFKVDANYGGDFEAAKAAAEAKGYGTATDDATLIEFLNTGATKGFIGETNTYGYVYDATEHNITNKNRVLFVLEQNNTSGNQNRFYNVYGYLTVTYNGVTTTYISNVQTLNIYEEGNRTAVVENNTSFA